MAHLIKVKIVEAGSLPTASLKGLPANLASGNLVSGNLVSGKPVSGKPISGKPISGKLSSNLFDELEIPVLPQHTLAQNIYLSGKITALPLCSGMGRCGLCRVRFLSTPPEALFQEQQILGAELLGLGWRLACKHTAKAGMLVELPEFVEPVGEKLKENLQTSDFTQAAEFSKLVLAVDLGTTTLHWQAFGCVSGKKWIKLQHGRELNPQMGAGSEVVSRLFEASLPGGSARLANLAQTALHQIIFTLPCQPEEICVAANTAMTCLMLGLDTTSLAKSPYSLPVCGNETYSLPELPPIYIPPLLSPFIGGDISAGICAILHGQDDYGANAPQFPFLMADLGTNGEFVLAKNSTEFYAASIPMGPALEGIGLSCGGMAGIEGGKSSKQVATAFRLAPTGITSSNIPLQTARNISGTGYFSLLHLLLKNGILNQEGSFTFSENPEKQTKLIQMLNKQIKQVDNRVYFEISEQLKLTSQDVEELLKIKAAFSLVFKVLLEAAGLSSFDLNTVYLAGSLGLHSSPLDLEGLGFLPSGMHKRVKAAGNLSLCGANLLLQNKKVRQTALNWTLHTKVLSLVNDPKFMKQYLEEMTFNW